MELNKPTQTPLQASSTGGSIVRTRTGLIHHAGRAYGGDRTTEQTEPDQEQMQVRRGRGRPRKNT